MGDDYYGYSAADNDKLADLRFQGRHLGENLTEYGDSSVGSSHFEDYQQTYKPQGDPSDPRSQGAYDYHNKKDAYGRTGASGSGIEAIYHRITAQDPGKIQALIDHWRGIAGGLRDVSDILTSKTDTVGTAWSSPGASQFFALGPGAALKSLNDWQLAAGETAAALQLVLHGLQTNQTTIGTLYQQYLNEVAAYHREIKNPKTGGTGIDGPQDLKDAPGHFEEIYAKHVAEIHQKYTYQAQVIENALGEAYWDGYNGVVGSTPGIYEGPTNAVAAPPGAFFDVPGGPGAVPGGAPGVVPPGLTPTGPPVSAPTAQPAPAAPPIAPGKAPVAPVAPVPVATPAPVAPGALPPAAPVAPTAPAAPAVVPPGTILPTQPKDGTVPLRSGTPGLSPGPSAALPKALAKGGVLGQPGNLPPVPGAGRAPGSPPPGRRQANQQPKLARPVLGGAAPDAPPPMPGAGRRPAAPDAGSGVVRGGRPGIPGTPGSSPASPFGGSRPAAPPVLGGRAARPGEPGHGTGRPGMPGGPGSGTPGAPPPGPRAPQAPGATRPVLNRPENGAPEEAAPRQTRRFNLRRLLPGGLSDPFGLTSRSSSGPVLNRSAGSRPVTGAVVGVPAALQGTAQLRGTARLTPGEAAAASRPVVDADLAVRHHESSEPEADGPVVRDEDVFVPQTPGGPVLAHGTRPDYAAEERVTFPGSG